jgi:hypothetical protein
MNPNPAIAIKEYLVATAIGLIRILDSINAIPAKFEAANSRRTTPINRITISTLMDAYYCY